jgi:hypothetical protein
MVLPELRVLVVVQVMLAPLGLQVMLEAVEVAALVVVQVLAARVLLVIPHLLVILQEL